MESDAGLEPDVEFEVSPVLEPEASPPRCSVGLLEFEACVEPPELEACVEFVLEPLLPVFVFELSPELLAEASPPLWRVGRSGSGGGALGSGPESLPEPFVELPEELPLPELASPAGCLRCRTGVSLWESSSWSILATCLGADFATGSGRCLP